MIVSHNYLIICCIINEALHFFQSVSCISSDHISEYVDLRTINNAVSLIQYFTCFFLNLFFKNFKMTLNTLSVFLIGFCNYFVHFSLHWIENTCLFLLRFISKDHCSIHDWNISQVTVTYSLSHWPILNSWAPSILNKK